MRILKLREEAKRIEARKRALGLDDARAAAARNRGAARSPAKRQLLRAIEDAGRLDAEGHPAHLRKLCRSTDERRGGVVRRAAEAWSP